MCETWLKAGDEDKKVKGDMTPNGYKLCSIPRRGRRGGGVALLHKVTLTITDVTDESTRAFESLSACISSGSKTLRLVILYRLIPNKKNGLTRADFLT